MSRRRLRSARWRLTFALLGYLALQIPMAIAIHQYVRLRDPMYGDKQARLLERIAEKRVGGERPFTVVMLGSSRTGYAFHGKHIEEVLETRLEHPVVAFNFGVPASGPVTHVVYLKRLMEAGIKPDLLLVEILPSMLTKAYPAQDPETRETIFKRGPLEKHWLFPDRIQRDEIESLARYGYDESELRGAWWDSVLHPWHALRFPLAGRVIPGWLPWSQRYDYSRATDECGWGTPMQVSVTPEEYRRGVQKARGEYEPVLATWEPGGGAELALRDLLRMCQEEQIPVKMVLMPEGTDFQGWYRPEVRERLNEFFAEITIEFDIPLIDARDWLPDEAFTDSHHMLRHGALMFSDRLAREELVPQASALVNAQAETW